MSELSTLIEKMLARAVPSDIIVETISLFERHGLSRYSNVTDNVTERDIAREQSRERQRKWREKRRKTKGNAEANDAAQPSPTERDRNVTERDGGLSPCNLLPSLSSNAEKKTSEKEERKKRGGDTRARGTRITADWQPSPNDRRFAIDNGVDPDSLRDEFVDYWVGVPGQRGVKLSWSGTWRNRVRAVASSRGNSRGKTNGARNLKTEFADALSELRAYHTGGDSAGPGVSESGTTASGQGD